MKHFVSLLLVFSSAVCSQNIVINSSSSLADGLIEGIVSQCDDTFSRMLVDLPFDVQRKLINKYLERQGFSFSESLDGTGEGVYVRGEIKKTEKQFYDAVPLRSICIEKPRRCARTLRHSRSPFAEMEPYCDYPFTYDHREQRSDEQFGVAKRTYGKDSIFDSGLIPVGPTRNGYVVRYGEHDALEIVIVEEKSFDMRVVERVEYGKKCTIPERAAPQEDYSSVRLSALTMNEATDCFYGGTNDGRVFRYYPEATESSTIVSLGMNSLFDWTWREEELPVVLENAITNLEITEDGTGLWLLSGGSIYQHTFAVEGVVCVMANLPVLKPDGDVLAPEIRIQVQSSPPYKTIPVPDGSMPEEMILIRTAPYENHVVLGGSRGSVVVVNLTTRQSFLLTDFKLNAPLADIWWKKEGEFLVFAHSGAYKVGTAKLVYAKEFIIESLVYA